MFKRYHLCIRLYPTPFQLESGMRAGGYAGGLRRAVTEGDGTGTSEGDTAERLPSHPGPLTPPVLAPLPAVRSLVPRNACYTDVPNHRSG